jgi:hypothetical protein
MSGSRAFWRRSAVRSSAYVIGVLLLVVSLATALGWGMEWLLISAGAPLWVGRLASVLVGLLIGMMCGGPAYEGWLITERWRHVR